MTEATKSKCVMRQSKLGLMESCGEAYRRQEIERDRGVTNFYLVRGSAVHVGRKHNLRQKIQTHIDLSVGEVMDSARDYVVEEFSNRDVGGGGELDGLGRAAIRSHTVDSSVELARLDYEVFQRPLQPLAVEVKLEVELPGYPFDLQGTLDVEDDAHWLRDLKTASKTPSQADVDDSEQLSIYSLMYQAWKGQPPAGISYDYVVALKKPKAVRIETYRTAADHQAVLNRLTMAVRAIEKGVFMPCQSSHWKCSPRWCEFYGTCRYVNGKDRPKS